MAKWASVFREEARQHALLEFGPQPGSPRALIEPRTRYISIVLRSARLKDARRGFDRIHGVAHSIVRLAGDAGPVEFSSLVAPPDFDNVKPGRVDRFIQLNHRLVGPVPYIGGAVEAQVGLFAVPGSDLAAPYVQLLQTLSQQAAIPFAAAARPFVEPLVQGINLLAGGGRGVTVEIGLDTEWSPVYEGRLLALRLPYQEAKRRGITIAEDGVSVVDAAGVEVADCPALVLEIVAERERPDWPSIPELAAAYEKVRLAWRGGRRPELNRALTEFQRIAATCVDLLQHDREAAQEMVNREVDRAGVPAAGARSADPDVATDDMRPFDQLKLYGSEE